jgi:hypothetical protein
VGLAGPGLKSILEILRAFAFWPYKFKLPGLAGHFYVGMYLILLGIIALIVTNLAKLLLEKRYSRLIWIAGWLFIPMLIFFGASHLFFSVWRVRYLVMLTPYFLILVSTVLVQLWQRRRLISIAIACLYLLALIVSLNYYYTQPLRLDYRGIVETINTQERSGDLIIWSFNHPRSMTPLNRYYQGANKIILRELDIPPTNLSLQRPVTSQDMADWLNGLPEINSRFWLVCMLESGNKQAFQEEIKAQFKILSHDVFMSYPDYADTSRTTEVLLLEPKS